MTGAVGHGEEGAGQSATLTTSRRRDILPTRCVTLGRVCQVSARHSSPTSTPSCTQRRGPLLPVKPRDSVSCPRDEADCPALAGVAQWVGRRPTHRRKGLGFDCWSRACTWVAGWILGPTSLPPSLPLPLKEIQGKPVTKARPGEDPVRGRWLQPEEGSHSQSPRPWHLHPALPAPRTVRSDRLVVLSQKST